MCVRESVGARTHARDLCGCHSSSTSGSGIRPSSSGLSSRTTLGRRAAAELSTAVAAAAADSTRRAGSALEAWGRLGACAAGTRVSAWSLEAWARLAAIDTMCDRFTCARYETPLLP